MNDDKRNSGLAVSETICSVFWLLMDASWMLGLSMPAAVLAVLTVVSSFVIFRYTERTLSNMLVTAAMAAWACMNAFWMLADLKLLEWGLIPSKGFLATGLLCLVAAFLSAKSQRDTLYAVLRRFRRLRLPRGTKPPPEPPQEGSDKSA